MMSHRTWFRALDLSLLDTCPFDSANQKHVSSCLISAIFSEHHKCHPADRYFHNAHVEVRKTILPAVAITLTKGSKASCPPSELYSKHIGTFETTESLTPKGTRCSHYDKRGKKKDSSGPLNQQRPFTFSRTHKAAWTRYERTRRRLVFASTSHGFCRAVIGPKNCSLASCEDVGNVGGWDE